MKMITLKSWDKDEFALEMRKEEGFLLDKIEIEFELNDVVMKNIDVFFEVLKESNIKKVIFFKKEDYEFDIVCFSRAKRYFEIFFGELSLKYKIIFEGLSDEYVVNELIGKRNYFIYCNMKDMKTWWSDKWLLNKEREMVKRYSLMEKYPEFKFLKLEFEKNPISSFNFPKEIGVDRFVYYYYVYDEDSRNRIIDYMIKLNFNKKYINYALKTTLNVPVMGYGLGFSYKNDKLVRRTFYISFYAPDDVLSTKKYFKDILGLNLDEFRFNNVWFGGVDDYFDYEEIKIYEENTLFLSKLEDRELEKIFKGKNSTRVVKFRDGKLVNEKVEFNLVRNFTDDERAFLEEKKIIQKGYRILALYLNSGKILKSTQYDL